MINTKLHKYIVIKYDVRGGIKIFNALARLASNSKFLLAKSEEKLVKIMSLLSICTACTLY
jgi:hypothetical protein